MVDDASSAAPASVRGWSSHHGRLARPTRGRGQCRRPGVHRDRAVGHSGDGRASGGVIALADHADAGVRDAVATALPALGLDEPALEVLRQLSQDADDDVRDWATIGLAESEANDPATVRRADG